MNLVQIRTKIWKISRWNDFFSKKPTHMIKDCNKRITTKSKQEKIVMENNQLYVIAVNM